MTTLPEEAVKAAARALCNHGAHPAPTPEHRLAYVNEKWPRFKEEAALALTAALPFLPVQGAGAKPIDMAPKTGEEFLARCSADWPWFSCFWDGSAFVHYDHDEGLVTYPATEWMPMPILSALEPSAARELALEALKTAYASMEGSCSANHRIALNTVDAAIRALGTSREQLNKAVSNVPDQQVNEPGAMAERELALEEAARNAAMYLATGFITCPRCGEEVETKNTDAEYALRAALSSPDHADAGKVEGDGWHVEYEVYSEDEWQAASTDLDGALDYAVMYAADGFKNITVQEVRRRTLPASEGAE